MKFIKKSIVLFMVIAGLQTQFLHAAEFKEEAPNYSDGSIYLDPTLNFEENYPEIAYGCEFFLGKQLQEYMVQELTAITETTEKKKHSNDVPFKYKYLGPVITQAEEQIEDAQIAYLVDAVKTGKDSAQLENDLRFQFLKKSPSTDSILQKPELPLLESIEKNNDILVNLLMIHNPNLDQIDWNEKFPVLAQGCEVFNLETPQEVIHASLEGVDQSQLAPAFQTLRTVVISIEEQIVQALKDNETKIKDALNNAIENRTSIDQAVIPALNYLIKNRLLSCIHQNFQSILMSMNAKFIDAIQKNNQEMLQVLLATGADVNITDNDGNTPLYHAILWNRPDIIQVLLAAGADINTQNINGETPLYYAASEGHPQIVKLLLAAGTDVNTKNNRGETLLYYATRKNRPQIVKLLLDAGADVNIKGPSGNTPLNYAILWNRPDIIQVLLAAGADINTQNINGETPLYYAASEGRPQIVKLLLDAGTDVNTKNNRGETLLYYAIRKNRPQIVKLLLDAGADVNIKGHSGNTPLNYAIYANYSDIVKLLLDAGADANSKKKDQS